MLSLLSTSLHGLVLPSAPLATRAAVGTIHVTMQEDKIQFDNDMVRHCLPFASNTVQTLCYGTALHLPSLEPACLDVRRATHLSEWMEAERGCQGLASRESTSRRQL